MEEEVEGGTRKEEEDDKEKEVEEEKEGGNVEECGCTCRPTSSSVKAVGKEVSMTEWAGVIVVAEGAVCNGRGFVVEDVEECG